MARILKCKCDNKEHVSFKDKEHTESNCSCCKQLFNDMEVIYDELNDQELTIEYIKKMAIKNYNTGGDVIIECWDNKDIQEFIDDGNKLPDLYKLFKLYHDTAEDIRATAF
jgi:hypothetical protein